jgi:hypothetical protein
VKYPLILPFSRREKDLAFTSRAKRTEKLNGVLGSPNSDPSGLNHDKMVLQTFATPVTRPTIVDAKERRADAGNRIKITPWFDFAAA